MKRVLTFSALAFFLLSGYARSASAATITVNTTDSGLLSTGCTLEAAVQSAETDKKVLGCVAGSGADTIVFSSSLGSTPLSYVFPLVTELVITKDLTIDGGSKNVVIDGKAQHRVVHIKKTGTKIPKVVLKNVTIQRGTSLHSPVNSSGGGILNEGGNLTLNNCVVRDNVAARFGGGIANSAANSVLRVVGGKIVGNKIGSSMNDSSLLETSMTDAAHGAGVFNRGSATLDGTEVTGNTMGESAKNGYGGGVSQTTGTLTVKNNAKVVGNMSTLRGGGIYVSGGSATISDASFSGNVTSESGGGVHFESSNALSEFKLQRSTVMLNSVTGQVSYGLGGGVSVVSKGKVSISETRIGSNAVHGSVTAQGGGLYMDSSAATPQKQVIDSTTVDHNLAQETGGGIYVKGKATFSNVTIGHNTIESDARFAAAGIEVDKKSKVLLRSSTIAFNKSGIGTDYQNDGMNNGLVVSHTILANNFGLNCRGKVFSKGYNLYETLSTSEPCEVKNAPGSSNGSSKDILGSGPETSMPGWFSGLNSVLDSSVGPVPVYTLKQNSRAMDTGIAPEDNAGNILDMPAKDARNQPRFQGVKYDIGAVERDAEVNVEVTQTVSNSSLLQGENVTFVVKVKNNSTAGTAPLNKVTLKIKTTADSTSSWKGIYFKKWTCAVTSSHPKNFCYQDSAEYADQLRTREFSPSLILGPGGEATFTIQGVAENGFMDPLPQALKTTAVANLPVGVLPKNGFSLMSLSQVSIVRQKTLQLNPVTPNATKAPVNEPSVPVSPGVGSPLVSSSTTPIASTPTSTSSFPTISGSGLNLNVPVSVSVVAVGGTSLTTGQSAKLDAVMTRADGTTTYVTPQCVWSTSEPTKALIQNATFMSLSGTGAVDAICAYVENGKVYVGKLPFSIALDSALQPIKGTGQQGGGVSVDGRLLP